MSRFKLLLFTHLSCFASGIYIGKSIDADELEAYRSASIDANYAWIKKISLFTLGAVASFVVWVGIGRLIRGSNQKILTSK
mmetsp:Transcript_4865/g.5398  ORF Transcript_4865/g.5398 Transcript_4865/m.5398 type:complete len:81 (-) Transcript_4865:25-267(-)